MSKKNIPVLIKDEPWLEGFEKAVQARIDRFHSAKFHIENEFGSILEFANFHQYYGVHYEPIRKGWTYREWAPAAQQLYLMGDFNNWDRYSHPLKKNRRGDWEIFLPYHDYKDSFIHESKIKVHVVGENGSALDRIPAYITRVVQDEASHDFSGQLWFPETPYEWKDQNFDPTASTQMPLIYECHVGMALEKEGVGTYHEFTQEILPRIKAGGYNAIQLMAVMEHPYYGSFGYHVSNFFAPSSRFGTPEELKALIDTAHSMGIAVIMDIVHSHAVKNVNEGLNEFDGSNHQYFHPGERGYHEGWDSKLFDYGKWEVQQFLLSNIRYWLDEFHFDGFRFDGATSMLYKHHGHAGFESAESYFNEGVDEDAVLYFQLANTVIHEVKPKAISIAEEVSGMPGLCRQVDDGGLGFDFRLAMGIPDFWIKTLKHKKDEEWDMFEIWHELTNRPAKEKSIAYAESHDQALVGDKSIAFWLMDKEMYFSMSVLQQNLTIDRGISLHKMIRLITLTLGGEGYLNFIGNEFGHPEWVDFPREGNNWSYQYARRQWSLVDTEHLRYQQLNEWDKEIIGLANNYKIPASPPAIQLYLDPDKKILAYQRADLIFIFSFHPTESYFGYPIPLPEGGEYKIILESDEKRFGGFERLDMDINYSTDEKSNIHVYLPNRAAMVLKKIN
ncbi:alpha-amylase family glycosyl hydrolase [Algoriphagus zhangzhouensis]|uniref:1,4-alpha-glucan branching enzyme n=1 Tax=Algoriphagus zhangzhouensis TaxID=1073327 RepID=A0A1M7Z7P8_9BACT|nr:alpha-amylase family glycosyl hydrolase [Algoriphagus zhangzhouensis]TDY49350.1 1,4-alpha-glucan branching enzyme [Algoriphagus zhangzhouensis]SHO60810.1 1,4-alpha-glucan branching enzyme [Algoriphagus zhangzhouensis]